MAKRKKAQKTEVTSTTTKEADALRFAADAVNDVDLEEVAKRVGCDRFTGQIVRIKLRLMRIGDQIDAAAEKYASREERSAAKRAKIELRIKKLQAELDKISD